MDRDPPMTDASNPLSVENERPELVEKRAVVAMLARIAEDMADMALEGEPSNARLHESMEAALTRAKYAVAFMPAAREEGRASRSEPHPWIDDEIPAPKAGPELKAFIAKGEAVLAHSEPLPVGKEEPVAWVYELASFMWPDGSYGGWMGKQLAFQKPCVPEGSVRDLTPLFSPTNARKGETP